MILHRLRLKDFRGVEDREIALPERGVVVVHGPNEIGKSSMLEALDLLLSYRDRSNHRDVKQVKPAHADVGAEVEAEISTGPYRFVYRKRFHKKHRTELEIVEPKREHLTGDEAHERVLTMLAQTVDTKLWDAQRVLQSASTDAVTLSGCDALSRALDAACGEVDQADGGGAEAGSLLVDRIEAEYLKFFTTTGRPTKELKGAIDRLDAAEAEALRCRDLVAEVDDRVRRHEELTALLREFDAALGPATERLVAAQQAETVVAALAEQLAQARLVATAAAATSANATLADGQRQQLVADAERRRGRLADLHSQVADALAQEVEARRVAESAVAAAQASAKALAAAQERLEVARGVAEACAARAEADRLAARLTRISEANEKLGEVTETLAGIALTDQVLADIEKAATVVDKMEAALQAEAGTVEFTAPADLSITVDGVPQTLTAGQLWSQRASTAVMVDVPGVLSVRIDPGATAVQLRSDLLVAQQVLADALARGGAADLAGARELDRERRALIAVAGQLTTTVEVLCDGDDVERLRARLAELQAAVGSSDFGIEAELADAELAAAKAGLDAAGVDAHALQKLAADAASILAAKGTQTTVLRDRLDTAEDEHEAVCQQLATLRSALCDEVLASQAAEAARAQRSADAVVVALAERFDAASPAAVRAELAAAVEEVGTLRTDRAAVETELHDVTVELGVMGSEGRQGRLDDAEAALDSARTEHARFDDRARAARLLRETVIRHRDNARQRYVRPYRVELERLGRIVFGPSFEVDVDTELTIRARTLDGRTVPFDSLSGGAKEQLGILARLAGAGLVADHDTVPVVIDDALGFSDPDRLDKMGAVFDAVGGRGQVIVLTCQPDRYRGITCAEVIELSA